ncbi:hypothetical protein PFISCL1PPCAC_19032, partial [Pristionchus fissidentatus]
LCNFFRMAYRLIVFISLFIIVCKSTTDRTSIEEMALLPKVSSLFEAADTIGEDFRIKYPAIFDDDELVAFKKELLDFFILKPSEQDELLAGFPSRFKVIPSKFSAMKKVVEEEYNALSKDDQQYFNNVDIYMKYLIAVHPLIDLVRSKTEEYERRGLTEKEIAKEVKAKEMQLHNEWYGRSEL